jgi:serine/threonine protein kinase
MKLGHYEIRSKIREGGMGEVYRAIDLKINRKVEIGCEFHRFWWMVRKQFHCASCR